ncbi:MAG: formimidoylglutamase [Caldilineaceae bacterium]
MSDLDIFQLTQRPDAQLLYKRGDPNDPRLGEIVQVDQARYADAAVVILGCPQDEGVKRNGGRAGADRAPDEVRRCLYRMAAQDEFHGKLFDLGNTLIRATLEKTHATQREVVRQVLRDGKQLLVLGGGNDIAYPDCAGLALAVEKIAAFNIDAHFDVRADISCNSGTPYRQLLEEGLLAPEHFYEIGNVPFGNSAVYRRYLQEKGVYVYGYVELQEIGIDTLLRSLLNEETAEALFWGFDLDVVRAADAPGVSAPNPVGLTGNEFCQMATLAGEDRRTRLVEFTEVNPVYDIDQRTCRLAAAAIYSFLLGALQKE